MESAAPLEKPGVVLLADNEQPREAVPLSGLDAAQNPVQIYLGDEHPRKRSTRSKWAIVLISSTAAHVVTAGSGIYTLSYDQFKDEWGTSREVSTLGLSLYTLAMGLGPLVIAPLSEFYGRRIIGLCSLVLYLIWLIPCALARNIETELVGRFFTGAAGSAFLSVAGGTVGDVFEPSQLQTPMLVYSTIGFLGPDVGPMIGGVIAQYTTWRWSFYVLMICTAILLALFYFFSPETYAPVLLRWKIERLQKETGPDINVDQKPRSIVRAVLTSCTRPFQLLVLDPMVTCLCILTAFTLGIQYLLFGGFTYVFETVYHFELWQIGLTFLGIAVGAFVAMAMDPFWRRYREKQVKNNNGISEPEYRLPTVAFGALCLPISLFWFGWTSRSSVHWIVPILGTVPFGIGGLFVYSGVWTFLVEAYPIYAASALGANAFTRLVSASAFPLFGVQMFERMGIGWAASLLGFLTLVAAPFPFIFIRYGKRLRGLSRFAKS
ncbi:hypothetical protein PV11_09131 [Exophiala sideris]|uniref:Major facilitator superfamily (MFS) profile domain-containing protein n=1 Tax=Exophiala sideris TaxID=1016849 RepID=A0A0D1Y382_9EURO|nr:hypothetical protein PV11_09131 [Exophiala sideris]